MTALCGSFEAMIELVADMIVRYNEHVVDATTYKTFSAVVVRLGSSIMTLKARGEETIIATYLVEVPMDQLQRYLKHWRDGCERLYRFMRRMMSWEGMGSGSSYVLTDFKCNGHLTGNEGRGGRRTRNSRTSTITLTIESHSTQARAALSGV